MAVQSERPAPGFTDVHVAGGGDPIITYRTNLVTYQEALVKGQFVGLGWNGSGHILPVRARHDVVNHACPQAFWVELDGQLLHARWRSADVTVRDHETGREAIVALEHAVRPVSIRVHTRLDGTAVLDRWLEIENLSDRPAALAAAFPWSGVLQTLGAPCDPESAPFSAGYFSDAHALNEGDFTWHPLPFARCTIDGRYRRDRHRHPFFVVRNHLTGEHFFGQLAWSGGYAFEFDLDDGHKIGWPPRLCFRAGPDAPAPQRMIDPGETVSTPHMHLGLVIGDLDACAQAMHEHLRTSWFVQPPANRAGLVEAGVGPEQQITPDLVRHEVDVLASVGAELFFIDASWYTPPNGSWSLTVGDWRPDPQRLQEGIEPIRDYVHEKGLLFGLWMEPERIGPESEVYRQHPDWVQRRYDGDVPPRMHVDMTDPQVLAWMEQQIDRLIGEYELDFFRLDYNVGHIGPAGCIERGAFTENTYWRYYEFVYAMWQRLRDRYPNVIFENCAGGGGRTDIGMTRVFNHTWITDWQAAPRSFSITSGMTLALPPERVDRLTGMGQECYRTADIDFQARLSIFVHPTVSCQHPIGTRPNPVQRARVRHALNIYKQFVRPIHRTSRIYHHTPVVDGLDPAGWGALELASADRRKAMVGLFRLADPADDEFLLRARGLDISKQYDVTFDNAEEKCVLDGYVLARQGIPIHLRSSLTSELLLIEAKD
ncbi:MAG: hypothetical protein CMJ18_04670 [Phycisphaeraceae bacterium]|nr:hypothetical protein [Phycisphaeraceae bacterium]